MSKAEMIAEAFDLQRRAKLCNMRGCGKLPTMRVTLFEENRITGERKTLATICLCNEHYQTRIPLFLTEINKPIERGKVIDKRVQDMGFITH